MSLLVHSDTASSSSSRRLANETKEIEAPWQAGRAPRRRKRIEAEEKTGKRTGEWGSREDSAEGNENDHDTTATTGGGSQSKEV